MKENKTLGYQEVGRELSQNKSTAQSFEFDVDDADDNGGCECMHVV